MAGGWLPGGTGLRVAQRRARVGDRVLDHFAQATAPQENTAFSLQLGDERCALAEEKLTQEHNSFRERCAVGSTFRRGTKATR
eukprot:COSAG02_NODE_14597_length_1256_cov_1.472774_1_plen_83_part_00